MNIITQSKSGRGRNIPKLSYGAHEDFNVQINTAAEMMQCLYSIGKSIHAKF